MDDTPAPPPVFAAPTAGLPPLKAHFDRALELYKKRLKTLIIIFLIGGVLSAVWLFSMVGAIFAILKFAPERAFLSAIPGLALFIGLFWTGSLTVAAFLAALAHEESGAKECFTLAKPRVPGLMWVHMLAGLLVAGGYCLLGIPGILFTVWFFFAPFVYIAEGLGGLDALLKSREYVRGHWFATAWRLFAGWVFLALLQAIPGIGQLLGLILAPLPYILSYQLYLDLKALRGDVPFTPSGKAKAGILAMGLGGFLVIPALVFFLFGSVLLMAFSQMKSKIPGMSASSSNNALPGASTGSGSKGSVEASVLDRVNIPDSPASGQIHGKPFRVERAEINGTILKIEQGKDFFADRGATIFLFGVEKGESLAGKTMRFPDAKGEFNAHVHVSQRPDKESLPKTDMYTDRYAMLLEFGQEKGDKLPVKIFLRMPDDTKSEISGRVDLEIKGLRMVDGHPDPKSDGSKVLEHVFQKHLEGLNSGKSVSIEDSKGVSWSMGKGSDQTPLSAEGEYTFKIAGGAARTEKVNFLKDSKGWRVKTAAAAPAAAAPTKPLVPSAVPKSIPAVAAPAVPQTPVAAAPVVPEAAPPMPTPIETPKPAAAIPPLLDPSSELVKEALDACRNEIGLFCYPDRENPSAALRCLKGIEDQALEGCRKKLAEARAGN